MPSFRRCFGLLVVALVMTACLTGCGSLGDEYARGFERAQSLEDKCYFGTRAAEEYAKTGSDREARDWQRKRDLACAQLVVAIT